MTGRSLSLVLALGILGGAVLVLSAMFFTPGKYILIPYAAVVLGSLLAVRAERMPSFGARFGTGLLAFLLSSLALYLKVASSPDASQLGVGAHGLRLMFLVGLGVPISLATARVASPSEHPYPLLA